MTWFGDKGNDTVDGGNGATTPWTGARNWTRPTTAVRRPARYVDLSLGTASDGHGFTDTLISIENVAGTTFNDMLTGDGRLTC